MVDSDRPLSDEYERGVSAGHREKPTVEPSLVGQHRRRDARTTHFDPYILVIEHANAIRASPLHITSHRLAPPIVDSRGAAQATIFRLTSASCGPTPVTRPAGR
jgi:hypothetical protein